MTLDECIDYAETQSEWMSKYAMIDIYKDKSEYYRQLAEWLRELKAYKEAEEEIDRKRKSGQWSEAVVFGMSRALLIMRRHIMEVNADE